MTGYDVDGALARGVPAVDVLSDYVAACRALGRTGTDPAQLHDAYSAEDGMDLGALDADCAAVEAALGGVREAARLQDEAKALLVGAWEGPGAEVAAETVAQHAQSSESATVALHRVAGTLAELRDTLWQLVSGKVTAVQDIEDRAEREQWWPAAQAVTSGAGAQDTASEIVDRKVNPFVTVAIGSDWADVMDSTKRSVRDAYDAAAAGISADPPPAAFGGGVPAPEPAASAPVAAPPSADPFASGAPLGGLGSGMPSLGTGLTGSGTQLADLIGGLLNSGADTTVGDPPDLADDSGDVEMEEDSSDEDSPDESDEDDPDEGDDPGDESDEDDSAAEAGDVTEAVAPEPDPPAPTPVPEPVPAAVSGEPVTPAPPAEPSRTPCEIASDELPQVGG